MIHVYCIRVETPNVSVSRLEAQIRAFADELPDAKRGRVLQIRPRQSRLNSALGWQLLKFALHECGYSDFTLSQLLFDADRKPRWPRQDCDFNLSHSGSLVACALTKTGRVGVDIEVIRPVQAAALLRRILSPREDTPAQTDDQTFFRLWTQKEAVIKAEGNGGVWDMRHVHLDGLTAGYKESRWYLYPLRLAAGCVAHVAGDIRDRSITIHQVSIERLLKLEGASDQARQMV